MKDADNSIKDLVQELQQEVRFAVEYNINYIEMNVSYAFLEFLVTTGTVSYNIANEAFDSRFGAFKPAGMFKIGEKQHVIKEISAMLDE